MDVSDLAPETAVYCIPATVQRKGPRFPGNVCPEWKMRTKDAEEEDAEERGGRQLLWEPGRGRSSYRKLDRRERKQPPGISSAAADATRSSGPVSWVGCCQCSI